MKKILPLFLIILMMTGCSKSGDIKKHEFTKSEKELLSELGYSEGSTLVSFDLDLSKLEVMEIETTIDYYKDGEFIERVVEMSDIGDDEALDIKNKRLTWSRKDISEADEDLKKELWTVSLEGGSGTRTVEMPSAISSFGMLMNEDFKGTIEKNKKYPLAIYYRSNANSFIASDMDFDNMDRTMEKLKNYDGAYILYIEIK